ncbi:hypothetical protein Dsin_014701 [Dipteronia sinensis]|uniref:Uncharacterized protein n=1 Tax=Dipteronia sinensis TaxID=43782 RepID=A0AAE0EA53_9ROSI|nr:hypothetical protein Dsin_014701 [Dipteronia sinensis]
MDTKLGNTGYYIQKPSLSEYLPVTGGMLIEFFDCSHEHRIMAMRKYHVPDESIILFTALCKYGEWEDSKSIMTDCSSSVSSGPDSDKCHLNIDFERKVRKQRKMHL